MGCKAWYVFSGIFLFVCVALIVWVDVFTPGNPYAGRRPADYPNTKWVSTDPDICFTVDDEGEVSGQLIINEKIINIKVQFTRFEDVFFVEADKQDEFNTELYVLTGECKFRKKKMVVKVEQYYLNELEDVAEITFVRMDKL
jgi:hypothetical protein